MPNKGKRSGKKNSYQKSKYSAHFAIAERNKKRRIARDEVMQHKNDGKE
jgi:hypothetical protein